MYLQASCPQQVSRPALGSRLRPTLRQPSRFLDRQEHLHLCLVFLQPVEHSILNNPHNQVLRRTKADALLEATAEENPLVAAKAHLLTQITYQVIQVAKVREDPQEVVAHLVVVAAVAQ